MIFPETITVEVTQEDIDGGIRKSCEKCPIASAFSRVFNNKYDVMASLEWLTIIYNGQYHNYITPDIAKQFMQDFDDGREVFPLKFEAKFDTREFPVLRAEENEIV